MDWSLHGLGHLEGESRRCVLFRGKMLKRDQRRERDENMRSTSGRLDLPEEPAISSRCSAPPRPGTGGIVRTMQRSCARRDGKISEIVGMIREQWAETIAN